jgi:hypothetical protein
MRDIVERLTRIADAARRADGSDIPLGSECREAAAELTALRARLAELEGAAHNILPYLQFTIGPESPGHHPTMPSAVAMFQEVLGRHGTAARAK